MMYTHIKTGHVYELVQDKVINATNAQDGERMVLYTNLQGDWFVREHSEFHQKFKVKGGRNRGK